MTPNSNQISQDQQKNPFCSLIPKNGESSSTNLEALNQDAISRLSSIHLPHIASSHSSKFIQIVNESVNPHSKRGDRELRRSLWGNEAEGLDQQSTSNSSLTGKDDKQVQSIVDDVLPEWYSIHNPRCQTCLNPLIRGLTTRRTKGNETICSNCRAELPNPKPNEESRKDYLSVRKRRKLEARGEAGNPVQDLRVEKGKRNRDEMEEIGMEQSNKKLLVKENGSRGNDRVENDERLSGTTRNEEKVIEKRGDAKSSASTDPGKTAMTLEERASELKRSKLKTKRKEIGSTESPKPVIDSRNDGSVSSTLSQIKPQIQGSDRTPTPNDPQVQSINKSRPLNRTPTSSNSAGPSIASSSKKNLANQSSTSKPSPNSSSSRRKQSGSNPKSDLKALLAKEKSKKEAEEKEKKNQGGGGLRGFLDSL